VIEPEDMIRAAVSSGPWPIAALKEILYEAEVTEWKLRKAVAALTHSGELGVVTQKFWVSPSQFTMRTGTNSQVVYAEGHSRTQLIARLSARTHRPQTQSASKELIEGEDAQRLAREAFAQGQE